MSLASLDELKAHLNITSSSDDSELDDILDAAQELVVSIVGEVDSATVTETVPVVGGTVILSRRPTGAVLVGGSPVGGTVNASAGLITGLGPSAYGGYTSPTLTVTYGAGTGDIPAGVRLATLIIAAHLWETQRGVSPSPLTLQGSDAGDFAVPGLGYAIPNRARELLAPYATSTQIA
jgi:hypothetical protein